MPFFQPQLFGDQIVGVALTLPRIAAAFLMLPLLTGENMPALVRNSFFVSLAIVVFPIASAAAPMSTGLHSPWPLVIMKEIFIGVAIGFSFGAVFWAIGNAGNFIDAKVGSTIASVVDPLAGHQTSLTGAFLGQLAAWLFMTSGAFTVFLDLLLSSYAVWPVNAFLPQLKPAAADFFIGQFNYQMTVALLLAAPALVVMSLVDLSLGLVNRYAQQLNVFTLTMPIKAWLGTWVVLLMLGVFLEVVVRKLFDNKALLTTLHALF
jgi:type III secretion protein T